MPTDMFAIIPELEALELHFRHPIQGEARSKWLVDWARDLSAYSLEDIQRGCKRWRMNGQRFPKPGELIAAIQQETRLDGQVRVHEWRKLSDPEYEALDLVGKIRHHMILAHEARGKAGPMFRNQAGGGNSIFKAAGEHLTREEMPEEWHRLQAVARGHDAEVKRLRGLLRTGGNDHRRLPAPETPRLLYRTEDDAFIVL
jgi:hypothetical protein